MSRGHGKMELYVLAALTHRDEMTTAALAAAHPSVRHELPSRSLRCSLNRTLSNLEKSGRIMRVNRDGLNGWTLCQSRAGTRLCTAYHEAGHAVVARVLGIGVEYATVKPGPGTEGHVNLSRRFVKDMSPEAVNKSAVCDAAGRLAETLLLDGDPRHPWYVPEKVRRHRAKSDRKSMREATKRLAGEKVGDGLVWIHLPTMKSKRRELERRAKNMVLEHRDVIDRVAEALIANETLSGAEIDALM